MRKALGCVCVFTAASLSLLAQTGPQTAAVPELHRSYTIRLSPSYSCRSPEEFKQGFANTALFLSEYSKQRNDPELVLDGACRAEDEFRAATAGDDFSLIADLGAEVSPEGISAGAAFNLRRVHSFSDYTRFVRAVRVTLNHTYAVLINEDDKRGLFVFKVVDHVPNKSAEIQYVVRSYQISSGPAVRAAGFGWERTAR